MGVFINAPLYQWENLYALRYGGRWYEENASLSRRIMTGNSSQLQNSFFVIPAKAGKRSFRRGDG
jgi:hypothetical protein